MFEPVNNKLLNTFKLNDHYIFYPSLKWNLFWDKLNLMFPTVPISLLAEPQFIFIFGEKNPNKKKEAFFYFLSLATLV